MEKTSTGLLEYARSKIGVSYVYGMKMEVLTKAKFDSLQKTYGESLVWDSDARKIGQVCCDCSGLISSYTGVVRSSTGYKEAAPEIYPISTIKEAPLGALVWMQGHVGIYSGLKNGVPYYVAADGSAYECRETKLSNNKFTHWFLCVDVEYPKTPEEETEMRYNSIAEMPDWAKPTIQKLIDNGYLAGDTKGLNLSEDMIRIFVVHDRIGLYKVKTTKQKTK